MTSLLTIKVEANTGLKVNSERVAQRRDGQKWVGGKHRKNRDTSRGRSENRDRNRPRGKTYVTVNH